MVPGRPAGGGGADRGWAGGWTDGDGRLRRGNLSAAWLTYFQRTVPRRASPWRLIASISRHTPLRVTLTAPRRLSITRPPRDAADNWQLSPAESAGNCSDGGDGGGDGDSRVSSARVDRPRAADDANETPSTTTALLLPHG